MTRLSGIYRIVNKTNGKYYIGSSNDIHKRWQYHKKDLTKGNHHSPYLQRSWNKHGKDNFDFLIVETNIPESELLIVEQKYIDASKENECYNVSRIAGKVEISDKLKGNKNGVGHVVTEEMKQKICDAQKGKKCPQKGNNKRGKKFSLEHRQKLSESHKGHIPTEETRQKHRERMTGSNNHNYGKKFNDEYRKKLSEAAKHRPSNRIGTYHSEESKRKMSEAAKRRKKRTMEVVSTVLPQYDLTTTTPKINLQC